MSIKYLTIFFFIILFSSCVVDDPKPVPSIPNSTCSSTQYTFYKTKKLDLSTRLLNNYIAVGFVSKESQYSLSIVLSDLYSGTLTSVNGVDMYKLKRPISCSELNNLRLLLLKQKDISFVSLLYSKSDTKSQFNNDLNFEYENYNYYSDKFIVELNKSEDLELLNQMITKTKTTLVSEIKPNQYLIKTDVNSHGDALEMANYFHESKQFKLCIPDWINLGKHIEEYPYFN